MITKIIENLCFDDYLKTEGVSKSGLQVILEKSPLHFITKKNEQQKESAALKMGTLIHTSILEPENIDKNYAVLTEKLDARTKMGKEKKELFEKENEGKIVLTLDEFLISQEIKKRIASNAFVKSMMKNGKSEMSMFWEYKDTQLKGRADFITENLILDVKTTQDASEKVFTRSIYKYKYHMQAAMYVDGYEAVTGNKIPFVILAIEKEPPFDFSLFLMDDAFLDHGRILYNEALNIYKSCVDTGIWHGYDKKIKTLEFWGGN